MQITFEHTLRDVENAQRTLAAVYSPSSLDATLPGAEEDFSLGSVLADPRVDVEGEVEQKLQIEELRAAVSLLPINSRKAVALHFLEGKTYEEIGAGLGLSRGRIGQIVEKSLGLLKGYMSGEISAEKLRRAAPSKTPEEIQRLREEERIREPLLVKERVPRGPKMRGWMLHEHEDNPGTRPGPNGELPPILQQLMEDMSRALMKGRSEFKKEFPNSFFPDETMTDAERQVFSGRRSLQNPDDFPKLCEMWGLSVTEGEVLYRKAELKYYSFVTD